jgi:hypothetical protein
MYFFYSSLGYVRFKECRNTCLSYYVFEFSRECRDHIHMDTQFLVVNLTI